MTARTSERCEVCGRPLTTRASGQRRRCRDHLAQLALFPLADAKQTTTRQPRRAD